MSIFTRRSFLSATAAVPLAVWLERHGLAAQAAPRVRFDARSPQGVAMLKVYAAAVKKMKDPAQIPLADPRSWLFQWYTHFVNSATTKDAELDRVFPDANDPKRALADAMWNTCQAHGDGENEDFFLPWHRCFVFFFEQIIASVSGVADFTLPYWNYSTPDTSIRGVIPPQFTTQDDPDFGSLFDGLRRGAVNAGRPIQEGSADDPLNLGALEETTYSASGVNQGFNQRLDFGLHGAVHVLVGGPENMGSVPTAAQDPIFWMHHCNLDRLWASWNAAGRVNPPLSQTFTFADGNGQRVDANIADFLDITRLGYTYDRFEPVPGAVPAPVIAAFAAPRLAPLATTRAQEPVLLAETATKVPLETATPANLVAQSVRTTVSSLSPGERVFLVAHQLSAKAQPGVLYNVYIDLPADPTPQQRADHLVGTLNFFGIAHAGGMHGRSSPHVRPAQARARFVSFDITSKVRALGASQILTEKPVLTIVPQGQPRASAQPVIGKVEIVVQ